MATPDVKRSHRGVSLVVAAGLLHLMILLVWMNPGFREEARLGWDLLLAGDPDGLRLWLLGYGAWAPVVSGLLQILSSLIPFLPGFVLGMANAMLYGALWGGLLTFTTALLAAAACFGIARAVGRPGVERFVSARSLRRVDRFMERRGMLAVFLGRLIPFINPDVLSYAAGATAMGWLAFLAAMAAGALPATVFYSIVGAMAIESSGRVMVVVLAATLLPLGLLALFRDRIVEMEKRLREKRHPSASPEGEGEARTGQAESG